MFRRAAALAMIAAAFVGAALCAATQRLYLKDGDFQLTSEYMVLADRVRYYSTERSAWEEIPLELVDLNRTRKEAAEQQAVVQEETKVVAEENAALRAEQKQVDQVPADPRADTARWQGHGRA
jgi:hypothetical protein